MLHIWRSCSVPTVFQAVLKNKYCAAQTEFLLTSQLLPFVLQNKGVVFWCFANNDAHTKYLFTPTGTVPNDWFSYQNAYQMLLISKFWRNYPVSESAIKLKGNNDLCEIYQNSSSGLPGFKNIHAKNVTTHNPHIKQWHWQELQHNIHLLKCERNSKTMTSRNAEWFLWSWRTKLDKIKEKYSEQSAWKCSSCFSNAKY